MDIELSCGFEILVARVLKGRVASSWNKGHDVYGSVLFPDLVFQVKYSNSKYYEEVTKTVDDRRATWRQNPTWSWSESVAGSADFYVLFGIRDELVYPFVVAHSTWMEKSSDMGNGGRIRKVTAQRQSRCGRYANSFRRNRFWEYYIDDWPGGLVNRIDAYYTNRTLVLEGE